MANAKKFLVKIANNAWITTWVDRVPTYSGSSCFFLSVSRAIDVPAFVSSTLGAGLPIPGDAIMADHEEFQTKVPRDDRVAGGSASGTLRI